MRITPIGRVLRATKIDELPQLYNVLRRDMNLVGPRPELPLYVEQWPPGLATLILSVRPGITGMASIRFVDEGALLASQQNPTEYYVRILAPLKTRIEAEYVSTRSLSTDLHILSRTLRAVTLYSPASRSARARWWGRRSPRSVDSSGHGGAHTLSC